MLTLYLRPPYFYVAKNLLFDFSTVLLKSSTTCLRLSANSFLIFSISFNLSSLFCACINESLPFPASVSVNIELEYLVKKLVSLGSRFSEYFLSVVFSYSFLLRVYLSAYLSSYLESSLREDWLLDLRQEVVSLTVAPYFSLIYLSLWL